MILAIDTATSAVVLGLLDGELREERSLHAERAHAELLGNAVLELYREVGRAPGADRIVVGRGPGSYTGLRVGASFALGLGRAWAAPVVAVSSLEGIAARVDGRVAASLDARKGMVYGGVYQVHAGLVTAVHEQPGKYPLGHFEELAAGATWLRDEPPSGLALAALAATRGQQEWQLEYL